MTKEGFEQLLDSVVATLREEAKRALFATAKQFENRVREVVKDAISDPAINIDFDPHPQAFPDIAVGEFGIEVKFTTNDTWRSVANSVLETNRINEVKTVHIVFGKMGGLPDVKWGEYEKSVMHVRTSHVPRFEVEIGATKSLFEQMGISYNDFRVSELTRKGVDYETLADKLKGLGVEENYNSINTKINRSAFTFQFFLQCMKAIDVNQVKVD